MNILYTMYDLFSVPLSRFGFFFLSLDLGVFVSTCASLRLPTEFSIFRNKSKSVINSFFLLIDCFYTQFTRVFFSTTQTKDNNEKKKVLKMIFFFQFKMKLLHDIDAVKNSKVFNVLVVVRHIVRLFSMPPSLKLLTRKIFEILCFIQSKTNRTVSLYRKFRTKPNVYNDDRRKGNISL